MSETPALFFPVRFALDAFAIVAATSHMRAHRHKRSSPVHALAVVLILPAWLLTGAGTESANSRRPANDAELRFWLENMVWHHRFSTGEIRAATGLTEAEIHAALERFNITPTNCPPRRTGAPLLVLPYPGGRHPRIGFLDGAVDPQRETKVSVFTPWDPASYVVVDAPEALWSNLGLTYLAHTHVPTVWTKQNLSLPRLEWNRRADGTFDFERALPNGIAFGTRIRPGADGVRMEMWLRNGTPETLSDLRVQNCVMLKGAAGFNAQTNANKILSNPYVACRSEDGHHWIITAWEPCHHPWANAPVPCLHSDPKFPDCSPGETKRLRGWLSFYEGDDVQAEFRRLDAAGWRGSTGPAASRIAPFFGPPAPFAADFGGYRTLLRFDDGRPVRDAEDWAARRREILAYWNRLMGAWPALLERPRIEWLAETHRENFTQHQVRVEIARGQMTGAYLLVPDGTGPFPAVLVPYYEPESGIGRGPADLRDFGLQLARRGFVTLSIGSPGGDARKPDTGESSWQPLSFLAYVAANCANALANLRQVDARRLGVVGHSYGGKWAMFAACLNEKFACGVWSDPGIVFDEARPNVNYWEPWYLGRDKTRARKPGLITPDNPRTGAYERLVEGGHDLHELLALMAPRPFLVSGGSEDTPERWRALNRVVEVNRLLGRTNRVAMTNRSGHPPTEESNEQIYAFFETFLGASGGGEINR
jgi:hypothetical protein